MNNDKLPSQKERLLFMVTTPEVPGYEIRMVFGPVMASVSSTSMGLSSVQSAQYRAGALTYLFADAARYGANAVVSLRFDSTQVRESTADFTAYGTATWVEPVTPEAQAQYQAMLAARRVPPQPPPSNTLPAFFGPQG